MSTKKTLPPWSMRKRIGVTILGTLAILLMAYVLGGLIYLIGNKLGWVENESDIKVEVMKEVLKDPALVEAVQNAAKSEECVNRRYGFAIKYQPPLVAMTKEGENACLQWELPGLDGSQARVIITKTGRKTEDVLSEVTLGMEDVWAESVYYQFMSGTQLQGVRDGQQFFAFVLEDERGATWIVEMFPANDIHVKTVKDLVDNMSII